MSDASARVAARLAELWQRSRPVLLERVAVLRAAHEALTADPAEGEARARGREAAHKLAGILGTFGLPQGSVVAAGLEDLLQRREPLTRSELALMDVRIGELDAAIASKDPAAGRG